MRKKHKLQNSETQTTMWQNSKTQIMRKLTKNQTLTNYKTQMLTKLKNQIVKNKQTKKHSNIGKTKKNSNCNKTQTQVVIKINLTNDKT